MTSKANRGLSEITGWWRFRRFSIPVARTLRRLFLVALLLVGAPGEAEELWRIALQVDAPRGVTPGEVLYAGVPFPKGMLRSEAEIAVIGPDGKPTAASARVLSRWPGEGSVRWLGIDFLASGRETVGYVVVPAGEGGGGKTPQVKVVEEEDAWVVTTGPARFVLGKKGALIRQASLDEDGVFGEPILENVSGDDLYVIDQNGREASIGHDRESGQLQYEAPPAGQSVLRAVFRREGWYRTPQGEPLARHVTRLYFQPGHAEVRIEHTLVLTEDTGKLWFREYGMRLAYAGALRTDDVRMARREDAEALAPVAVGGGEVYLFQKNGQHFSEENPSFEAGRSLAKGRVERLLEGRYAGNWLLSDLKGRKGARIGIALRDFARMSPKELSATPRALHLKLWSSRGGEMMDFRFEAIRQRWPQAWYEAASEGLRERISRLNTNAAGMGRTHEWVIILGEGEKITAKAAALEKPVAVMCDPRWLRRSEVFGTAHYYDPERFPQEEAWMEAWFDQHMAVFREWGDEGFFEFGNWPHVWYQQEKEGPRKGKWAANIDRYAAILDYGFSSHLWRMYSRSGKRKYLDAARETTRQRLDMVMAHWSSGPEITPESQRLPRRLKGTYTFSNSPICWSGNTSFHHNSGTDIRSLIYDYYLCDNRLAHEMFVAYGEAVKKVWQSGIRGPFRGTRPFTSLKNLATVYQETGDPVLREITLEQLAWMVDVKAPQGVSLEAETTRLGKYGVKVSALHRVYEATGSELAAQALIRGAETRALTSLGETPFGYYHATGEQYSIAFRLTGDPVYLRAMKRDMAIALDYSRDPATGEWGRFWASLTASPSTNVYPMGGMAYAMDALIQARKAGTEVPLTPYARQAGYGPKVWGVVRKEPGVPLELDLRSEKPFSPALLTLDGKPVQEVELRPFTDQIDSLEKAATRWRVALPAAAPEGVYLIDTGRAPIPWEVTWSSSEAVELYAPEGLILGTGDRQWGNRIMAAKFDHRQPAFLQVGDEAGFFEIYSSGPVRLTAPSGRVVRVGDPAHQWQKVMVAKEERAQAWRLEAAEAVFVRWRGDVAATVAFGDPRRGFPVHPILPEPEPLLEGKSGSVMKASGDLQLKGEAVRKFWKQAEGTLEGWFRPQWESVELFSRRGAGIPLMKSGTLSLVFHRHGEMSLTALVGQAGGPFVAETHTAALLRRGQWAHFALQWKRDDGKLRLELYLNGEKQTYGREGAGMPLVTEESVWKPSNEIVLCGKAEGELTGIRLSSIRRYTDSFRPRWEETTIGDHYLLGRLLPGKQPTDPENLRVISLHRP